MKRNSLKAKILTGIVTSFVFISSSSIAFAEEMNKEKSMSVTENSNEIVQKDNTRHHCNDDKEKHKDNMKYSLESAMKDKIITAEEYDKIMKHISDKCDKKLEINKNKDIYDDLVDNKILSKDKAKDLKKYIGKNMKLKIDSTLDQLIKDGIINKKEAKEVKKAIKERKPLEELIQKGIITQEQYDKIIAKLHNHSEKCSCNE
ncbi:Hypothetical protein CM240_1147 [Clostridium bornimense]|uniref:Secreted protein n=1 Tax=Clostridium bornimense TaxID=1216932 RepID=W6RUI0_9CLOT|nr:hypothetical protein [Clostridium bornimense]CDM68311.1 Hypothetical protein CM240_1147 [Clostridium bornimense]